MQFMPQIRGSIKARSSSHSAYNNHDLAVVNWSLAIGAIDYRTDYRANQAKLARSLVPFKPIKPIQLSLLPWP
jgi:hypothetical protein